MSERPAVAVCYEGQHVTHFRVGGAVTVRTSDKACGNYCCLTCLRIDCEHAKAAEDYDKGRVAA